MSIAHGHPIGPIKQLGSTPQGMAPYSSSARVTQADQDDFEKALHETDDINQESGWNEANQKQFSLGIFQLEHSHSIEHDRKMKEIYDDLNSSSQSQKPRHT
jgi:hypothetical protein